jgi:hypothetical protein
MRGYCVAVCPFIECALHSSPFVNILGAGQCRKPCLLGVHASHSKSERLDFCNTQSPIFNSSGYVMRCLLPLTEIIVFPIC